MNPATKHPEFDGHEDVVLLDDPGNGLAGFIAIHSTALGPAVGGCRRARYHTLSEALADALRLSQGMSYKNAMAGLAAGGGKAVLCDLGLQFSREAVWTAFGQRLESLRGRYITAEDVGTAVADMQVVARRTRFVAGLPRRLGKAGGDPSPWTALGVFVALQACMERPLAGARVAVQGLGAVGFKLCERLHRAGAHLVVADIDSQLTARAQLEFKAEIAAIERIHSVSADAFSPNALGAVLNPESIPEIDAPIVCGGANNQLSSPRAGELLLKRGVTYAPDYVVNAGGIINVMAEFHCEAASVVEARVLAIGDRVSELLARARTERRPPNEVADEMARSLLGRSRSRAHPGSVAQEVV
jgi:leucine dehydrogenase